MRSAAKTGAYYKARTKKYLERAGYQVAFLERVLWIQTGRGRVAVKRDQFASDLLAVNDRDVVFVQVKGGKRRKDHLADARAAFEAFCFPPGTKQWIVLWKPRAREPEIVIVSEGPCGTFETERNLHRRKPYRSDLPLFR